MSRSNRKDWNCTDTHPGSLRAYAQEATEKELITERFCKEWATTNRAAACKPIGNSS